MQPLPAAPPHALDLPDAEREALRLVVRCPSRASGRLWAADEAPGVTPETLAALVARGLVCRCDYYSGTLYRLLPEGQAVAFALGLALS